MNTKTNMDAHTPDCTEDCATSPAPIVPAVIVEPPPQDSEIAAAVAEAGHDAPTAYEGQGPTIPGVLNRGMRRYMEKRRTKHAIHLYRVATLIACKGYSHEQAAQEIGLSRPAVSNYWREAKTMMGLDFATPEAREAMASYCLNTALATIERSMPMVAESAAHGAVLLKALEYIASITGIDAETLKGEADKQGGLTALADHLKARSVALGKHQAAIDAIKAGKADADGG